MNSLPDAIPASTAQIPGESIASLAHASSRARPWRFWVLLALSGLVYTGFVQRLTLVKSVPQLASLFDVIGMPINVAEAEIRTVRAKVENIGLEQRLTIEGEILNLRKSANTLPDIKLSLIDASGGVIYTWVMPLPEKSLKPGGKLSFKTNLTSPPAGNRKVVVAFAI